MNASEFFRRALDRGQGVVRLAPAWVPRSFLRPGGRLRLHPNDLYALGPHRGGIDERWLASTVKADNGADTPADEGLSYVEMDGELQLLGELAGSQWQVLCKLFDNGVPIPHHLHPNDAQVAAQGFKGKPEAYYFPPQYNQNPGPFPYTFFGLQPHTSPGDVRRCLERWGEGDNGILNHSQAFKLKPGTGWQVDANVLHAPGTLVTYEPQAPSDTGAMFESMCAGEPLPWDALVKFMPEAHRNDLDYILGWIDFEKNTDPFFSQIYFRPPGRCGGDDRYMEKWIAYGSPYFSAKELSVGPRATVKVSDLGAHGALVVQGHGRINGLSAEAPSMVRFGQMTADEFFVTEPAAREGIVFINESASEPMVILKHFGPGHPDSARFIEK